MIYLVVALSIGDVKADNARISPLAVSFRKVSHSLIHTAVPEIQLYRFIVDCHFLDQEVRGYHDGKWVGVKDETLQET